MSSPLADLTSGFRDPVHGAQRTFRAVLTAMSRPGTVVTLPAVSLDGVESPRTPTDDDAKMNVATASMLLALLDAETTIALAGRHAHPAASAYLRFHTGARIVADAREAAFVLLDGGAVDESLWSGWDLGSDEVPQAGATIVIQVDALDTQTDAAISLELAGPGIARTTGLAVDGLHASFWAWRIALQSSLPRGIDLVLTAGDRIAAIPRSTRVAVTPVMEDACT